MKTRFTLLVTLLCASMVSFAIDWNSVEWLGNGIGEGYSEKYKAVVSPELPEPGFINNLQLKNNVPVMHVCFPSAAFGTFSLNASQYDVDGAGAFFHLDAFTAQETEFTVVCSDVTYTFTVFYVDGTVTPPTEGLNNLPAQTKATKIIENGQVVILKNGVRYNLLGSEIK